MDHLAAISPRTAFDRHARLSPEEERRLREEVRQWQAEALQVERTKRMKREHDEELHREAELLQVVQTLLATPERIEAFTVKLDRYDVATVEALLANEHDLTVVGERLRKMLDNAEQLPDGRRVFKTEDGHRVFDEHGQELSPEEIDPDAIDDGRTRFEPYWASHLEQKSLVEEREALLEYQQKLDDAREIVGKEGVTARELDELEKALDDEAPDRVRKLAGEDLVRDPELHGERPDAAPVVGGRMSPLLGPAGP